MLYSIESMTMLKITYWKCQNHFTNMVLVLDEEGKKWVVTKFPFFFFLSEDSYEVVKRVLNLD